MRAAVALLAVVAAGFWATPASAAAPPSSGGRSVTLISGDRLQVSADGRSASRLPSPGRDGVPLLSQVVDDRLQVVPADAVTLLNDGRLDPRLFDVTGLLAAGYDDTRGNVPLIVTYDGRSAAAAVRSAAGGAPAQDLPAVNGSAVRVETARTAALWSSITGGSLRSAYRKIWLDGVARPGVDRSVPLVGAPAAWAAGYTGREVPVGVLDTGVDTDHPDLAGTVAEAVDFTDARDGIDRAGHGTHVASIIAGSGAASGGRYRGMAPDVRIYSAKVCAIDVCPESSILAGMQWAARDKRVKVVNLSLGHTDQPGADLLEQAVGTLTAEYGTLFVIAAGNDTGPVSSPASADAALAVGATTRNDTIASFSNGGTRPGDGELKPDITAPGVGIVAARSGDSALPGGKYTALSGTSMAAAHVAGAAALLAQQHPDWSPIMLKAALMSAGTQLGGERADFAGAGRLDVAKAVASPVLGTPGSLFFAERADTGTVTYRNTGASAITLALSLTSNAPAGMLTLDDTTVTVPAHGEASARVTADPQAGTGDSRFTGALVAASGDLTIRTTLAMAAGETFALTVRYTDRTGAPTARASGGAYAHDGTGRHPLPNTGGTGTVRLPKGTYTLAAEVFEAGGGVSLLNRPELVLDRDTTVEMDARLGRPVTVAAPRAGATQVYARVAFRYATAAGAFTANVQDDTFDGMSTAQIGPGTGRAGFRTDVSAAWARIGPDGTSRNSPYLYSLAWSVPDRYLTGFTRTITPADLRAVRAEYGAGVSGTTGLVQRWSSRAGDGPGGWGYTSAFDLPFQRTEYLNTGPGLRWGAQFAEITAAGSSAGLSSGPVGPARTGTERWNGTVFGPAFPPPSAWANEVSRTGNTLVVNPSWLSDGSGEHAGPSIGGTHHTVVTRDGKVVADTASPSATLAVPASPGEFTVTNENTRQTHFAVRNRTKWTFRSGNTPGRTLLPVSAVRFTPRPGNVLGYSVQHQAGGATATLTLEVSYDDGRTWRMPLQIRIGDHGVAFLRPSAGDGFVSLRAAATDTAGNGVEQSTIRAYSF